MWHMTILLAQYTGTLQCCGFSIHACAVSKVESDDAHSELSDVCVYCIQYTIINQWNWLRSINTLQTIPLLP